MVTNHFLAMTEGWTTAAGVKDRFLKKWLDYLCFVLQAGTKEIMATKALSFWLCQQFAMENHHVSWENPLFQWSCSIAMLNYWRLILIGFKEISMIFIDFVHRYGIEY